MDLSCFKFPTLERPLIIIILAFKANGVSSYRDAVNIIGLSQSKWPSSSIYVLTDSVSSYQEALCNRTGPVASQGHVHIHACGSGPELLKTLKMLVETTVVPHSNLLFVISSHGYSERLPSRTCLELNGRSEYLLVGSTKVFDFELFKALYEPMHVSVRSLCLVDTCHSGTLLDLEYLSSDGKNFTRSHTVLKKRPLSVCISACSDSELSGEDISKFGGWGGKLICQFLDAVHCSPTYSIGVLAFFQRVARTFAAQTSQRSHPVISYNE